MPNCGCTRSALDLRSSEQCRQLEPVLIKRYNDAPGFPGFFDAHQIAGTIEGVALQAKLARHLGRAPAAP
jgi:hypothetical protein